MIPVLLLIVAVVLFRLVPTGWENFSPMAAVVLCSAAFLPRRWAAILPLSALLISDMALNARYGETLINANTVALLAAYALVFGLGWSLRARPRVLPLFACTVLGSLLFYLVTSTAAWAMNPVYVKSGAGWWQAMTIGDPSWSPAAWVFFRNSLAGDLFFTALFVVLCVYLPKRQASRTPDPAIADPTSASRS